MRQVHRFEDGARVHDGSRSSSRACKEEEKDLDQDGAQLVESSRSVHRERSAAVRELNTVARA